MIVLVIIWSKLLVISLIKLTFQMVGTTRSSPNGFGASGSGDLPPPPPMNTDGGLHGHPNRGAAPDPADVAADRPADEPRATTRGQPRGA
jgi:hypothetical protein